MFQLSTLHTSQLRLSPPRNLIINPLSLLWDKLLPDQIGINRRISAGAGRRWWWRWPGRGSHGHTRPVRGVAVTGDTGHQAGCVQWSVVSVSPYHHVLGSRVTSSRDSWPSSSQVPGHTASADAAQVVEGGEASGVGENSENVGCRMRIRAVPQIRDSCRGGGQQRTQPAPGTLFVGRHWGWGWVVHTHC